MSQRDALPAGPPRSRFQATVAHGSGDHAAYQYIKDSLRRDDNSASCVALWFGPTATAGTEASSDNCVAEPLYDVVHYPDGGSDYEFMIDGSVTHMPVPLGGFRPETADAATLARYGFPPRRTTQPWRMPDGRT